MLLLNLSIIVLLISGCTTPQETDDGNAEPASSIDVTTSFPDGAPPLNQTAELVCIVNNHAYITLRDMSVDITLPDGFELVSGELSWLGDIPEGDEVEVIRAVINSVKVGNWTIDCTSYLDPEKHGGLGRHDAFDVYVSVTEDSAEWAYWPLWQRGDPSDLQIEQVAPADPINLEISFPNGAPALNQTAELKCTVKPHESLHNMSVKISLPSGFELISGELSWFGSISANDEIEVIRAVVKSIEVGNWTIEGTSYLNPEENFGLGSNGWYPVYVAVSEDSAEWGKYPPWYENSGKPVKIEIENEPPAP